MKMSKGKKRFLISSVAIVLIGAIFATTLMHDSKEIEAKQNVLAGMETKYSTTNQVKVLEIVPTDSTYTFNHFGNRTFNVNAELGYFMPQGGDKDVGQFIYNGGQSGSPGTDTAPENPLIVSKGAAHGEITSLGTNPDAFKAHIYNMYLYGLIKPDGADQGWNTGYSDYPIYCRTGYFSQYQSQTYGNRISGRLVNGAYKPNTTGTGKYDIIAGYCVSANSTPKKNTIKYIDTTGGSVSYNDVAIDTSRLTLPTLTDGTQLITENASGTGNLDFEESQGRIEFEAENQMYKGYSNDDLYFSSSNQSVFLNGDWWNEYVMGDLKTYEASGNETPYRVKKATDVGVDDIDWADLIYISGTNERYVNATSDISQEVMLKIYNDEINYKHKAVMMDCLVYDSASTTNISQLAKLLWQSDQAAVYNESEMNSKDWFEKTTDAAGEDVHNLKDTALTDPDFQAFINANMKSTATGNGNFVTGNTYVYNHHVADFVKSKSQIDALDNIANGDFATPYTGTVVSQGLSAVSAYIEKNNKESMTSQMSNVITPAVCIQYILVNDGTLTAMSSTLRVLEIQPVPAYLFNPERGQVAFATLNDYKDVAGEDPYKNAYNNRIKFIDEYLPEFYKVSYTEVDKNTHQPTTKINLTKAGAISFTSMTVAEFNAHNEDLIENYDVIYIGDETTRNGSFLYYDRGDGNGLSTKEWNETDKKYTQTTTKYIPHYNDSTLEGAIYYNIGDTVSTFKNRRYAGNLALTGWLDGEDRGGDDPSGLVTVRYSGRDITKDKLKKCKEFIDSGKLVLVAENLMGTPDGAIKNTQINPTIVDNVTGDSHGRVDNSSNLYELLAYGLGKTYDYTDGTYKYTANAAASAEDPLLRNVVAVSDIIQNFVDKETLAEFVSAETITLNIEKRPKAYAATGVNSKGIITGEAYLDTLDENTGLRYLEYVFSISSASEKASLEGYEVSLYVDVNKDGKFSKTTERVQDVSIRTTATGVEAPRNADNSYRLDPNQSYTMVRYIPDDYCGLLHWKLDIQSRNVSYLHDSQDGYTMVQSKDANAKKVVKILQITNNASNLDLEGCLYNTRVNGEGVTDNSRCLWGAYIDGVIDYDVYIRTITVSEFETTFNIKYNEYKEACRTSGTTPLPVDKYATEVFFEEFVVQNAGTELDKTTNQPLDFEECPLEHTTPGGGDYAATQVKASELRSKGEENVVGVNMLVCGFGDAYTAFGDANALTAVSEFIDSGKPVLTTHDFLMYRINHKQSRSLRNQFGMDIYGASLNLASENGKTLFYKAWALDDAISPSGNGATYLHSALSYTRSADAAAFSLIESTGKEVAYQPNSMRNKTVPQTQGFSNSVIDSSRSSAASPYSWINADAAAGGSDRFDYPFGDYYQSYNVQKINDGQITTYPYSLGDFTTVTTHSQWFTLDLTSDLDDDGESDVVVWYALGATGVSGHGKDPYSDSVGASLDPANGFYIYNDGNITYTGAGHAALSYAGKDEVQLFVNTLLAAFEVGVSAPSASFYETTDINAKPISTIVVPYDGIVTKSNTPDSSILKKKNESEYMYKFVDPNTDSKYSLADGTVVYYRIGDYNFVRGTKDIGIRYYLQVPNVLTDENGKRTYKMPNGDVLDVKTITVNNTSVSVVDISGRVKTYQVKNHVLDTSAAMKIYMPDHQLTGVKSEETYGIYLPMDLLNKNSDFTIIMEAETTITSISTAGNEKYTKTKPVYIPLTVTKADLLDLD